MRDLRATIESCISAYRRDGASVPELALLEDGVLPLIEEWGGYIGVRPDLKLVYHDQDNGSILDLGAQGLRLIVLFALRGSKWLPELRSLLPLRPEGAPACTRCSGSGKSFLKNEVSDDLPCIDCSGLGWVPDGFEQ